MAQYNLSRITMPSFHELNLIQMSDSGLEEKMVTRNYLFRRQISRTDNDDIVDTFIITNEMDLYVVHYEPSEQSEDGKPPSVVYGIKNDVFNYEDIGVTFDEFKKTYKNSEFYDRYKDEVFKQKLGGEDEEFTVENDILGDTQNLNITLYKGDQEREMLRLDTFVSPCCLSYVPCKKDNEIVWMPFDFSNYIYRQTTYANRTSFASIPKNTPLITVMDDDFTGELGKITVFINGTTAFEAKSKDELTSDQLMQIASVAIPVEDYDPWDLADKNIEFVLSNN